MRFKDTYAVVTGTSSGIGKAVAMQLVSEGAVVFGLDRNESNSNQYQHFTCDVSNEKDVIDVRDKIIRISPKINYLVNVAGVLTIGRKTEIKDQAIEQWENVIKVNLTSFLIMIKNFYPSLKKADNASIVNISSDQTFKSLKASAPYIISKTGINALTKIAALEMLQDKIRVNAVAPGSVRTNILKSLIDDENIINQMMESADKELPLGISEPIDVASVVCFLLSNDAKRITGQVILADSGKTLL